MRFEINPEDMTTGRMKSPVQLAIPSFSSIMALGWQPKVSIEHGFRRVIDHILEEKN